jgi:hypothetical protein
MRREREDGMEVDWKTYRVAPGEGGWEPATYNIRTADGQEYGRWRRVLRKHVHGLTVISHYKAPPGKAWKIIGKASRLGEEVYILGGAYYDSQGRILAGPLWKLTPAVRPAARTADSTPEPNFTASPADRWIDREADIRTRFLHPL